jgi:hypothetical protein
MRYFYSIVIFITSIGFISCSERAAMPGRAFEGKIVQQISIDAAALSMDSHKNDTAFTAPSPKKTPGISGNATVTIYVKGDKVATDLAIMGGFLSFHSIIDRNARTMTLLVGKRAYVTNLRTMDKQRKNIDDTINARPEILDSLDQMLPKATGMKKTINGLECEEYIGTFKGMEMNMWITQDPRLKFYDVIQDAFLGRSRTGSGGMEQIMSLLKPISGEGRVPVKMIMSKEGKTFITSELKEMTEEKVDEDVFEIPKDYQIIKSEKK